MVGLSESGLWYLTQVLDYGWMVFISAAVAALFGGDQSLRYDTLPLAAACALLGTISVASLYARERTYFWLLGDRIPRGKQRPLSHRTLWYLFQTGATSMSSFFAMYKQEIIYYTPFAPTLSFWCETFATFYALLVLRDFCFLYPLHQKMHTRRWHFLHKKHHEVTSDAQSLHAFHIDFLDLVIENVGAPFLLLSAQYVLNRPVGIHWGVGVLLTVHDGALHSVNPFSVFYFNPLLDRFLEPNVNHQLHHALNKGFYMFVPWGHALSAGRRREDCSRYNKVFNTDYAFE